MKIKYFNYTLIFALSLLLGCTIQKRTVKKGYFVQWNFKLKSQKASTETTKKGSKTLELESTDLSENHDSSFLLPQEPIVSQTEEISADKKDFIQTEQEKVSIKEEQTKLKKSISPSKKIKQVIETNNDAIKKAKMKKLFIWFSIALILSFTFGQLWLSALPFLWVRILNILFAILGLLGLIKFFKLHKELKSKTEKPKEQSTKINRFRNMRNLNIILLILSTTLLVLMTVAIILAGEFYWTVLIIYLPCLHVCIASINEIVCFQKLHHLQKKSVKGQIDTSSKKTLEKQLKKGRRTITFTFIGIYLAFIGFMAYLIQMG